ncbi:hypothetical protein HRbin02_01374 [Candidatus Calditenuaceae archaeon HR02]|nr:hypothetical protein HRbin02_01374 [Candidatus Calditenuaceae archaeon HR02]
MFQQVRDARKVSVYKDVLVQSMERLGLHFVRQAKISLGELSSEAGHHTI